MITYRKVYAHDFDSIGEWWVFKWESPTGVGFPWGAVDLSLYEPVERETS